MKNIMLVGDFPKNLPASVDGECYSMMRRLNFSDKGAVLTVIQKDFQPDIGENILMYGFHLVNPYSDEELPYKIMKKTGIPTRLIASVCQTIGKKSQPAPRIVASIKRGNTSNFVAGLKSLHVGCDVEIHAADSYVPVSVRQDFYVHVKLPHKEVEHFKAIINGLKKIGISRDQIWTDIIHDFVPADKLK